MYRTDRIAFVFLLALVCGPVAEASTIVLFGSERSVVVNATSHAFHGQGAWSESRGQLVGGDTQVFARQDSMISAAFLGGTGVAEVTALSGAGSDTFASSNLRSLFTITEPYLATLDVEFDVDWTDAAAASLRLERTDGILGPPLFEAFGQPDASTLITQSLLLLPGTYAFQMLTFATLSESVSFAGGLTLEPLTATAVPEPATITLFGLGLAAAAWRRRGGVNVGCAMRRPR